MLFNKLEQEYQTSASQPMLPLLLKNKLLFKFQNIFEELA